MGQYDKKPAGRHSAPQGNKRQPAPRREALHDNYYYEDGGRTQFEDISSYSSEQRRQADRAGMKRRKPPVRQARRPAPQRKPPKRKMSLGSKIALALVLLVVAGVGLAAYMFMGLTTRSLSGDLGVNASVRTGGVKNIALFGVDSRDGVNEGRSDALMVLTVDSRSHTLKMASIMRDSEVYIEDYGYDKVTHAYAYGGPELAIRTLNQNFSLDIEDYITVNFYEMAEIVDAFGGVELELTGDEMLEVNRNLWNLSREAEDEGLKAPIEYDDYFTDTAGTHNMIDGEYEGGTFMLNGVQAVAYSRIRYIGGDGERTSRQQEVLQGLLRRAKQRSVLSYPSIVHGVMPHCETSLNAADLAMLTPFALGRIKTETATFPTENEGISYGKNENGLDVVRFDSDLMVQHLHQFIYGNGA